MYLIACTDCWFSGCVAALGPPLCYVITVVSSVPHSVEVGVDTTQCLHWSLWVLKKVKSVDPYIGQSSVTFIIVDIKCPPLKLQYCRSSVLIGGCVLGS